MSFIDYKDTISEGDTVILYLGVSYMQSIVISPSKVHQTKYGAFPHSEMIGKRFGSKIFSKNNKGWIFLLHPTPELWTVNLPHRTQILYSTDISMAIMQLGIKPGAVVVESGTGSGSMSHALIRTVAPTGHLYTFEFHEERCEKARKEFQDHKVNHLVTIKHRDVLKDGFELDKIADAVFLDLPCPWDAISTSKQAIKEEGGRICSFSPCIEQIQKTCASLTEHCFKDIKVMECLLRSYEVKPISMQIPDLSIATTELAENEIHSSHKKRKTEDRDSVALVCEKHSCAVDESKVKSEPQDNPSEASINETLGESTSQIKNTQLKPFLKINRKTVMTAKPARDMPGHTGFLTFATLFPKYEKNENNEQN